MKKLRFFALATYWHRLAPILPRRSPIRIGLIAVQSLIAGMLEAALVVMVVSSALALSEKSQTVAFGLPLLGETEVAVRTALITALCLGGVMLALHLVVASMMSSLAADVLLAARVRIVEAYSRASWERQAAEPEGSIQESVGSLALQSSQLVIFLCTLLSALLGLIGLLFSAIAVEPAVTGGVLLVGVILYVCTRPIAGETRRRAREFVGLNTAFSERIGQWSSMAAELRTFGVEAAEARKLRAQARRVAESYQRSRFMARAGNLIYRDLAMLILVGSLVVFSSLDRIDLSTVGAVVLLMVRSLSYAQQVNGAQQQVSELAPNLEVLEQRVASISRARQSFGCAQIDGFEEVRLEGVSYSYRGASSSPAVSGISLTIRRGEIVGLIGPSGGGKTTLLEILLRLRLPTEGVVTVDGVPYQSIAPSSWSKTVGLVPQEPKMFPGTVMENIQFYRPDVDREAAVEAAELAAVRSEIDALPSGFDTMLEPRGAGLSGGQRQRIAIARALARKPSLIVLDEPTSALDVRSEASLIETIRGLRGDVGVLIVAHRLASLESLCDRVIAMRAGRVVGEGSLDEAAKSVDFGGGA